MNSGICNDMILAYRKAIVGYMQCGEPSPKLVWIMSPAALIWLRHESQLNSLFRVEQRSHDGGLEFLGCEIREDDNELDWRLWPANGVSEACV